MRANSLNSALNFSVIDNKDGKTKDKMKKDATLDGWSVVQSKVQSGEADAENSIEKLIIFKLFNFSYQLKW